MHQNGVQTMTGKNGGKKQTLLLEKRREKKKGNKINTWLSRCSYSSSVAVVDVSSGRCSIAGQGGGRTPAKPSLAPKEKKKKKRKDIYVAALSVSLQLLRTEYVCV